MHRRLLFPVAFAALAAGAALHAALAPVLRQEPPEPGPQHRVLQQMVGEWDVVIDIGGAASKATQSNKSMPGGMFILGDITGEAGGQPFHGHGVWGYDQGQGKYVSLWVDNFESSLQLGAGSYDEKTRTLTLDLESDGFDGKPATYHHVTRFVDKDRYDFEMSVTSQASGETTPMGGARYTRKQ